jgi:hypothetical protein
VSSTARVAAAARSCARRDRSLADIASHGRAVSVRAPKLHTVRWPTTPGRDSRSNPVFDVNWPYRDHDIMTAFATAASSGLVDEAALPRPLAATRAECHDRRGSRASRWNSWWNYSRAERRALCAATVRWPTDQSQLATFANGDVLDAEWHARLGDSPTTHRGGAALVWCEANLVAIAQIIGQQICGCRIWHTAVLDQHDVRIDVDTAVHEVTIHAYRMWRSHADTYLNLGLSDEAECCRSPPAPT